jgi:hypothetical protein
MKWEDRAKGKMFFRYRLSHHFSPEASYPSDIGTSDSRGQEIADSLRRDAV